MHIYREESEKKTILKSFTILINHEPWVKEAISAAIEDKKLLQVIETYVSIYLIYSVFICTPYTSQVSKGSNQAHSDDSNMLKNSCIKWIQDNLMQLLEPPLQVSNKAGWSFNHPVLARMLCPRSKQDTFVFEPKYVFSLCSTIIVKAPRSLDSTTCTKLNWSGKYMNK